MSLFKKDSTSKFVITVSRSKFGKITIDANTKEEAEILFFQQLPEIEDSIKWGDDNTVDSIKLEKIEEK